MNSCISRPCWQYLLFFSRNRQASLVLLMKQSAQKSVTMMVVAQQDRAMQPLHSRITTTRTGVFISTREKCLCRNFSTKVEQTTFLSWSAAGTDSQFYWQSTFWSPSIYLLSWQSTFWSPSIYLLSCYYISSDYLYSGYSLSTICLSCLFSLQYSPWEILIYWGVSSWPLQQSKDYSWQRQRPAKSPLPFCCLSRSSTKTAVKKVMVQRQRNMTPTAVKMQKLFRARREEVAPMKKAITLVKEVIVMEGPECLSPFTSLTGRGYQRETWSMDWTMTKMSSAPIPMSRKGRMPLILLVLTPRRERKPTALVQASPMLSSPTRESRMREFLGEKPPNNTRQQVATNITEKPIRPRSLSMGSLMLFTWPLKECREKSSMAPSFSRAQMASSCRPSSRLQESFQDRESAIQKQIRALLADQRELTAPPTRSCCTLSGTVSLNILDIGTIYQVLGFLPSNRALERLFWSDTPSRVALSENTNRGGITGRQDQMQTSQNLIEPFWQVMIWFSREPISLKESRVMMLPPFLAVAMTRTERVVDLNRAWLLALFCSEMLPLGLHRLSSSSQASVMAIPQESPTPISRLTARTVSRRRANTFAHLSNRDSNRASILLVICSDIMIYVTLSHYIKGRGISHIYHPPFPG